MPAFAEPDLPPLTPRERDILRLIGDGLSNAEIAERLVVSLQTVKWYVKEIYAKLGVHSRDEALAVAEVRNKHRPETQPPDAPYSLPVPITSLINRQHEIVSICAMLRAPSIRLVTLIGAGGVGKTRLSLEAAHRLTGDFPDGAAFVSLAPVSDPALVVDAILDALGMEPGTHPRGERLYAFLRHKRLLLVLDNCEHLLAAAPLTGNLLAEAPAVKLLATSREPLRVYGEYEFSVPPLDPASEAVALFEARARLVQPGFAVNAANVDTVRSICERLDGLPLAIELAAARTKFYTPQVLLTRLDNRLRLLTGGARDLPERQQTMRGAISWSYDLLTPDEQRLFTRFSVFEGGASLDAFAEICGFDLALDPFDGLESLVGKSLIQQEFGTEGEHRFMMYESLREFATGQLATSEDEAATRQAHARYYLALGAVHANRALQPDEFEAFSAFVADYANIRTAWLFATGQPDDDYLLAAAHSFKHLFSLWSWTRAGLVLYEAALLPRRGSGTLVEANLLAGWAYLSMARRGTASDADIAAAQEAATLFERLGRPDHLPGAVFALMTAAALRRDLDEAERLAGLLGELGEAYGEQPYVDVARYNLAGLRLKRGDIPGAMALYESHLAEVRPRHLPSLITRLIGTLITLNINTGNLNHARELSEELTAIAETTRQPLSRLYAYSALTNFAELDGDMERAYQTGQQQRLAAEQLGRETAIAVSEASLASLAAWRGDGALAQHHLARALARADTFLPNIVHDLVGTAAPSITRCLGLPEQTVECAAFALQLKPPGWHGIHLTPLLAELEAELGPETYAAAWARGAAMTIDDALELARELAAGDTS